MYERICRQCGNPIYEDSHYEDHWYEERGLCSNCRFSNERGLSQAYADNDWEKAVGNTIALSDEAIEILTLLLSIFIYNNDIVKDLTGDADDKKVAEWNAVAQILLETLREKGRKLRVKTY